MKTDPYLVGICAAPPGTVAGAVGAGTVDAPDAGICVSEVAGGVTVARSRTLPVEEAVGRALPKKAKARVATKNTAARTAVVRERKLALPEAPKRLPELPLPKAAPMSAPLPC